MPVQMSSAVKAQLPSEVDVLGADAVPVGLDRAGIGELAHLDVSAAVAQHLYALRPGCRMAAAVHHEIGAEAADDLAHRARCAPRQSGIS